ncbi:hypothetical protein [Endozoicomonas sp. YOMI1]|uniref:hypothetical protein n=1 Tax=Endozoicomonas sp. YOMI1 TaxID=2828739 RepID=UPI0021474AAA|nr:hypothetical protein [Endozoicomonas sp. YOMI1]
MKRGRGYAQLYVPSVLANEHRVIPAFAVGQQRRCHRDYLPPQSEWFRLLSA